MPGLVCLVQVEEFPSEPEHRRRGGSSMKKFVRKLVALEGRRGLFFRQRWWWHAVGWNGKIVFDSAEQFSSPEKRDESGSQVASQLGVKYEKTKAKPG
jgi:hypothetical protein